MNEPSNRSASREDLRRYLQFLKRAGFLYLVPSEKQQQDQASRQARAQQLNVLHQRAIQCTLCRLAKERKHVVFGEGNPDADLMFVGEAPGADEDQQARPFVGRSGRLLDEMMQEVGLRREDVFICNILKCRPPENRDPEPEEITSCEPYLRAQIDLIQPSVIVALGRYAAQCLSGDKTGITKMRGTFQLYHEVKMMPTFHPAAVLRNMNQRTLVVDDLRRAVEEAQRLS